MSFQNYGLKATSSIITEGFAALSNSISEINGLCGAPRMLSTNNILQQSITPKKVIFNNPATIVFWDDGSKTVSKASKDDEFDKMKGFLTCYYKKISNTSNSQFGKMYDKFNNMEEVIF
jgi:ABC-type Fe3+-hydroxamate transport system substrate-binding protein